MIRAICGVIIILIFMPVVYGKLIAEICHRQKLSAIRVYALGFAAELSVFYALYLIMLRINRGLRTLTKAYLLAAVISFVVLAVVMLIRKEYKQFVKNVGAGVKSIISYIVAHPLIIAFALIVIWEIAQMIMYTEVAYSDDDSYSPMIMDMIASDGFFAVDPDTGYPATAYYMPEMKYMLTAWLPFQAFGALICGVHPLIFTKTILPCALIILHYLIMWELAGIITGVIRGAAHADTNVDEKQKDNRAILMIFYALLLEFGWSSLTTTLSYYFLTWLWYGKAFVQFVTVPLLFVEALHSIFDEEESFIKMMIRHIIPFAVVLVAGVMASMMGVFLGGSESILLIVAYVIYKWFGKKKA